MFENVKFPEDNETSEIVKEKKPAPKVNLADFVKQDLKKIITSVEYFDEEKFEGGKRIKKKKEVAKVEETSEENKNEEKVTEESSVKATKRSRTGTKKEEKATEESSVETNKRSRTGKSGNAGKKVKTASGTFKVSKS